MLRRTRKRQVRNLQPLLPGALYPLKVLRDHTGLGENCIRRLRQSGLELPVIRVGRCGFVEGAKAIEFVKAAGQLDAQANAAEGEV